jgi:hypothetical protein
VGAKNITGGKKVQAAGMIQTAWRFLRDGKIVADYVALVFFFVLSYLHVAHLD